MRLTNDRRYQLIAWLWLFWISGWTVVAVAPQGLNADILLNSVMSLQNLTLFYWGQDRLLNLLPAFVTPITDPALNLAAVLLGTSLSFNLLLHAASRQVVRLLAVRDLEAVSAQVFITLSGLYLFLLSAEAISKISIGHIEYSLSALLLVLALSILLSPGQYRLAWSSVPMAAILILLSLGLNPSSLLAAAFIPLCVSYHRRHLGWKEVTAILVALGAFLFWRIVSSSGGTTSYFELSPAIFLGGISKVAGNMLNQLNLSLIVPALLICILCYRLVVVWRPLQPTVSPPLLGFIRDCVIVFSAGWMIVFASNRWVEINAFDWRYFTYVFFACLLLLAAYFVRLFTLLRPALGWTLTAAVMLAATLATVSIPKGFRDYRVFRAVNALTPAGQALYTGDYWAVWPSVLRDMMAGHEAYGLTERGQANRDAARHFLSRKISADGYAEVQCLKAMPYRCIWQTGKVIGPFQSSAPGNGSDGVTSFKISGLEDRMEFSGNLFLALPSNTGAVDETALSTDGGTGFLVYGPYWPLSAGDYLLTVHGSAETLTDAFVDVVSGTGKQSHARFRLEGKSGTDHLLHEAPVHLPDDTEELEVRVWTGAEDVFRLYGYSLLPKPPGRQQPPPENQASPSPTR